MFGKQKYEVIVGITRKESRDIKDALSIKENELLREIAKLGKQKPGDLADLMYLQNQMQLLKDETERISNLRYKFGKYW